MMYLFKYIYKYFEGQIPKVHVVEDVRTCGNNKINPTEQHKFKYIYFPIFLLTTNVYIL